MAVDPKYRGKGIAKKLLTAAAKKAKKVGLDALTYEVEYKNKPSINFIQKFSRKFKNETPAPMGSSDSGTLIFRYRFEKDEDEMTSAILSTAPQGGELVSGDNYATNDMRIPRVFGKMQKRKKEESAESIMPKVFYRYMSIEEINDILSYNAFRRLIDHDDDSEEKVKNPAGNLPYFKSFTYKLTENDILDFMGDGHVICVFDANALKKVAKANKCKLLEYVFDNSVGSIHEYEYRLYSKNTSVPVNLSSVLKKVILCEESGVFEESDIEEMLTDFSYNNINVPVVYIANPLTGKGEKFAYSLDEDENLQKTMI